jgi:hypothetical protein
MPKCLDAGVKNNLFQNFQPFSRAVNFSRKHQEVFKSAKTAYFIQFRRDQWQSSQFSLRTVHLSMINIFPNSRAELKIDY